LIGGPEPAHGSASGRKSSGQGFGRATLAFIFVAVALAMQRSIMIGLLTNGNEVK
jgi:hypothetical protein